MKLKIIKEDKEWWLKRRSQDKKNLRVLIGDSAKGGRHVKKGGPYTKDPPKYKGNKGEPGLGLLEEKADEVVSADIVLLYLKNKLTDSAIAKRAETYFKNLDPELQKYFKKTAEDVTVAVEAGAVAAGGIGSIAGIKAFTDKLQSVPAWAKLQKIIDLFGSEEESPKCAAGTAYDPNQKKCVVPKIDGNTAVGGIPTGLWAEAVNSFKKHKQQITNRSYIAVMDFSKPNTEKRLWIVEAATSKVVLHSQVGHGKNSGGSIPSRFSNVVDSQKTSLGAYITGVRYQSPAGKLGCIDRRGTKCPKEKSKKGPALNVHGLDSTNSNAHARRIIFHGASYGSKGGRSFGCFTTDPIINRKILKFLGKGSFVYAGPAALQ